MALSNGGRSLLPVRVSSGGEGDRLAEVLESLWLYKGNVGSTDSHHLPEESGAGRFPAENSS